jgi:uncharacterized protein YjiS (DUF1127 family)
METIFDRRARMSILSQYLSARRGGIPAVADIVSAASTWVLHCAERAAQRRALARLDDWLLRDIGLTRSDVREECEKWFWRQ